MLAIDTNVIVRYLVRDDQSQAERADDLIGNNRIWIAKTVLLETEWVLRDTYSIERRRIADILRAVAGITTVQVEDEVEVASALDWFAAGMDFADALHLASSARAREFATFDQKFVARAARLTPFRILALR
jgi:predicted nucleic-acid-binding protein